MVAPDSSPDPARETTRSRGESAPETGRPATLPGMTTHNHRPGRHRLGTRQAVRRQPRGRRHRPGGTPRRDLRRARPQRRRQDHDAEHAGDPAADRRRRGARSSASTCAGSPHQVRQLIGVTGQYASVDENLTAYENLWLFGRLLGLSRAEREGAGDHPDRAVRARGGRRPADRDVLRRHAPPARPRGQPDPPAAADLPRRADHRPRPADPRPDVGHDPLAGGRRQHGAAHHAVPRRGRPARRPGGRDRPRPQGRRGHPRRAQDLRRRLDPAAAAGRPRPAQPGRPDPGAGAAPRSRCSPRRPAASTSPSMPPTRPPTR